jgi:hypothetical protein
MYRNCALPAARRSNCLLLSRNSASIASNLRRSTTRLLVSPAWGFMSGVSATRSSSTTQPLAALQTAATNSELPRRPGQRNHQQQQQQEYTHIVPKRSFLLPSIVKNNVRGTPISWRTGDHQSVGVKHARKRSTDRHSSSWGCSLEGLRTTVAEPLRSPHAPAPQKLAGP